MALTYTPHHFLLYSLARSLAQLYPPRPSTGAVGLRKLAARSPAQFEFSQKRIESMIATSGKMVLLDKLLPKLKREGHKVGGG